VDRFQLFEQYMTRCLEWVISILFFVILSLTIIMVIMRYGFNSGITGGNEAMSYLFIYTTALGAAISIGKRDHIKITILVDKLKPLPRRYINILNYLLVGFINGVMIYYSIPWIRGTGGYESPVLRMPNWIVQSSIPIGCGLVIVYCFIHIVFEILYHQSAERLEDNL